MNKYALSIIFMMVMNACAHAQSYPNPTYSGAKFTGSTSGQTAVKAQATASGTLTFPAATDTLVGKATTDTFTNKTFNTAGTGNSFQINGTPITATTGSGAAVLATSPTLVTPTLGAASGTSLTLSTPLPVTSGGTGGATQAAARTGLGLGTAATQNTGTSGANVPLLSTANTWSASQVWSTAGLGTDSVVALAADAGTVRAIDFRLTTASATNRWRINATAAAESGGNTGTNFAIGRYDDSGAFIDNPIAVTRSTGVVSLSQPLPVTSGGTGTTTGLVLSLITGHRLTLSTGVPVMAATVSAATTVFSTPYTSDILLLWNGSAFVPTHCAQTSQALSDTTKSPAAAVANAAYDLFAWNDSGTCRVTRGPPWSTGGGSLTARGTGAGSTAISRANAGILTNVNAITNGPAAGFGTYMGTIITDGSATANFNRGAVSAGCTASLIGIWNMYNRVSITSTVGDSNASHSYSTNAFRSYGNYGTCNTVVVRGLDEDAMLANNQAQTTTGAASSGNFLGIGLDSTTTDVDGVNIGASAATSGTNFALNREWQGYPGLGLHTVSALESADGNPSTFGGAGKFVWHTTQRY